MSKKRMRSGIIGITGAVGMVLIAGGAMGADTVTDHLRHGWKIRAAWGGPGEPILLLQKANKYMICNFELRDNPRYYETVACNPVR